MENSKVIYEKVFDKNDEADLSHLIKAKRHSRTPKPYLNKIYCSNFLFTIKKQLINFE